jgi:hypothetical protein
MPTAELIPPPRVLVWYRVYCAVVGSLSLVDVVAGGGGLLFRRQLAEWSVKWLGVGEPAAYAVLGALVLAVGLLQTCLFWLAFFLPRRPWAWVYHLALIGLGLTDPCFFFPCIFLMVFWLKAPTRTYFGCDQWLG